MAIRLVVVVLLIGLAGPSLAHRDADINAFGHRTFIDNTLQYRGTPQLACDRVVEWSSTWDTCVSTTWTGTNWDLYVVKSGCCGTHYMAQERHCPMGQIWNPADDGATCIPNSGACYYNSPGVSWLASSSGALFINVTDDATGDNCLWTRTNNFDNGDGTWSVEYVDTAWDWSDHDGFGTAPTSGAPVGAAPPTATGTPEPVWPWSGTGGGGPESGCAVGDEYFAQVPWTTTYDIGTSHSICMTNSCEAAGTLDICLGQLNGGGPSDNCGGTFYSTGAECTYTDGTGPGESINDNATSGGSSVDVSGIESRLDELIAQGDCNPLLDPRCDVDDQPALGDPMTMAETVSDVYTRISNAPIVAALDGIGSSIPAGACPTGVTDPIAPLGDTVLTFDAHCTIWQEFAPTLHAFMLIVWSLIGVGVVFRA